MAVQAGWVGTSAKGETNKASMGEARLELRLPKAGWMSEMIGKSTEVIYINTVNRTQVNIHTLMGSPTVANVYVFENTMTISATTQGEWALRTGSFPAGSTLRIINRWAIRGGGGNGGVLTQNGFAGGTALILDFPATIDNTSGTIWGGGGGGGGAGGDYPIGGGGGAGVPAGNGGTGTWAGSAGTSTAGGAGGRRSGTVGGTGGALGSAGGKGDGAGAGAGGRGGYSVQTNGNAVSWIAVGDRRGAVV